MNALKKLEPTAYAVLRIVFGFFFACHGATKIFGVLGGHKPHAVLEWTGAGIELVGGILILIGLLTSLAAFICSGEMAVAYFMCISPEERCLSRMAANLRQFTALSCCTLHAAAPENGAWKKVEPALFKR